MRAIVVLVDVGVGTVVDVVPLGGATVVVVVVVVVGGGSVLLGGVSTVSAGAVVVVVSSGPASAIEPGSVISATTAGATARSRFERDTMLTTSRRTSETPGYTARLHRHLPNEP